MMAPCSWITRRWSQARSCSASESKRLAVGEHVLKLVPPCNAADAIREIVLPRLDLGVPSPRLHAVLER
jgi:hypothetical protein